MSTFWLKMTWIAGIALLGAALPGAAWGKQAVKPTPPAPRNAAKPAMPPSPAAIPQFEFEVWGQPPAQEVYELARQRAVQGILYVTNERPRTLAEIAAAIGETEKSVADRLARLEAYQLMERTGEGWRANVPLYTRADLREAEAVGLEYAERQAAILRREIPRLRALYGKTVLARSFAWDEVSLVIVGAMLCDFCVIDRIPFQPKNLNEKLQPRLRPPGGKSWSYDGYEKGPDRFPSRPWKFYQNVFSKGSGGMTRFGYHKSPDERRQSPLIHPGQWLVGPEGRILFALAEGPRSLAELQKATGLAAERLKPTLQQMAGHSPPALSYSGGLYRSRVPILTEGDLEMLLPECDRIAEEVFRDVVLPHLARREARARELGRRWPLPADTFVRDKALALLAEEGLIGPIPAPPVPWSFGLWGWQGLLAMHQEVTDNVQPDPFLKTAVGADEKRRIDQFAMRRLAVLNGQPLRDVTTPENAFLTRASGFIHRDIKALQLVQIPADDISADYFTNPRNQSWTDYMRRITVRRLPPVPARPQEGSVYPVFTVDDRGFEEVHIYFYYRGAWRLLCNTPRDTLWHVTAKEWLPNKLASLAAKR